MVGTPNDPGLMVLSLNTIFDLIEKDNSSDKFEVTCSYLEVYNEVERLRFCWCLIHTRQISAHFWLYHMQVIYDLLEKSSGHLELREDPELGIIVAGLRSIKVNSCADSVYPTSVCIITLTRWTVADLLALFDFNFSKSFFLQLIFNHKFSQLIILHVLQKNHFSSQNQTRSQNFMICQSHLRRYL